MRRSRSAFHASSLEQLAADAQRMLQQTDRELHMSRQLSGGYNAAAAVAAVGGGSRGYGCGIDILEGLHVITPSATPPPTQQQQQQQQRRSSTKQQEHNFVQRVRSPLPGIPIRAPAAPAADGAAVDGHVSEVLCCSSRGGSLPLFVGTPATK